MIKVTEKRFYSTLDGTGGAYTPTLQANIGDFVTAEIYFYFENTNVASDSNVFILCPKDPNTLDTSKIIYCKNTTFVKDLKKGDTIDISVLNHGHHAFIVTEILSQNTFSVSVNFNSLFTDLTYPCSVTSGQFINTTEFHSAVFNYNLINSGVNYNSLVDGSLQEFTNYSLTSGENFLNPKGLKDWQTGTASITYEDYVSGKRYYKFVHTFIVTPFYLVGQKSDVSPSYLKDSKTLNYIFKLGISTDANNFDLYRYIIENTTSSIGYYNENYNGGVNDFYIDNYEITNIDASKVVSSLEPSSENKIVITLKSNTSIFGTVTKIRFGFNSEPISESSYKGNNKLLVENFNYDTLISASSGAVINGANYGASRQIIKTIKSELVDTHTIQVTAYIKLGSAILLDSAMKYLLTIAVEGVSLSVQEDIFVVELGNLNLVNATTKFIGHQYDSVSYGTDTIVANTVDDLAINTSFSINFTDYKNDNVKIISITPEIVLKKSGENDIILESIPINVSASNTIDYDFSTGGKITIQDIAFAQKRPFKTPKSIRSEVVLSRDYNNDNLATNTFLFALNYPLMIRWEYWDKLIANTSVFFDSSEKFNGFNQNWKRLTSLGWSINYRNRFIFERKGKQYQQEIDSPFTIVGFLANSYFSNVNIKSYKQNTTSELTNGTDVFINSFEPTKIIATWTNSLNPNIENVGALLSIEPKEKGGENDIRQLSSMHDSDSQSWFVENRLAVTKTGTNSYKCEANIDNTKLPIGVDFSIYLRVYDINGIIDGGIITNDNIIITTINNETILYL